MRFISLYYSSIGLLQICKYTYLQISDFISLKSWKSNLQRLQKVIQVYFPNAIVYSFSTGRGATAALLKMAAIGKGDEVIISAFTCLAVPTAVLEAGAKPIYVDINRESLNNDVSSLIESITPRTKAIILQHTLGNPSDVNELMKRVEDRNIIVIEDCALSLASKINDEYVGKFAHASIFSMELSKTLSTGWGGILLINNPDKFKDHQLWYDRFPIKSQLQSIKDIFQSFVSSICHKSNLHFIGKYIIYILFKCKIFRYSNSIDESSLSFANGFTFRMSNGFNRLSFIQWKRLHSVAEKCKNNYQELRNQALFSGYCIPDTSAIANSRVDIVSARFSILVRSKENFINFFLSKGFEVGLWFDGPLTPEPQHDAFDYNKSLFPNSCYVASHIVNLPCHSRMSKKEIADLKKCILDFANIYPTEIIVNE